MCDHIHYALALAQALSGDIAGAHENLKRAIELEPRNRLIARQDADFAPLANQPPFDALVYPEKKAGSGALRRGSPDGRPLTSSRSRHRRRHRLVERAARSEALHPAGRRGHHRLDITAIVTVTDDGGSSGRLRREFDVLPPGDIRNCMVALSEDSALLSRLFQYRFRVRPRAQGPQFRQPLPDGSHTDPGRFSGCREGLLGSPQNRRPHLSQHHGQRVAGSHARQRRHPDRAKPESAAARIASSRSACGRARCRRCPPRSPPLPKPT